METRKVDLNTKTRKGEYWYIKEEGMASRYYPCSKYNIMAASQKYMQDVMGKTIKKEAEKRMKAGYTFTRFDEPIDVDVFKHIKSRQDIGDINRMIATKANIPQKYMKDAHHTHIINPIIPQLKTEVNIYDKEKLVVSLKWFATSPEKVMELLKDSLRIGMTVTEFSDKLKEMGDKSSFSKSWKEHRGTITSARMRISIIK